MILIIHPSLQVNVLSTFLLAGLLAPLIAKTGKLPVPLHGSTLKPHLVIVASDSEFPIAIDLNRILIRTFP
jgi:hypothetical protein